MTNTEYNELLKKHPDLTAHGYGVQRDSHLGSTYWEIFDNMRQELQGSLQAFNSCCTWIECHPFYEPGWSSYTLKHEVENGSISHRGRLKLKRIPNDIGVYVD